MTTVATYSGDFIRPSILSETTGDWISPGAGGRCRVSFGESR